MTDKEQLANTLELLWHALRYYSGNDEELRQIYYTQLTLFESTYGDLFAQYATVKITITEEA